MRTQDQINDERAKLEKKLAQLDNEEQKLGELTPTQRLAEGLHTLQCHWNHTDGCGWDYENWEKGGYAHDRYHKKAQTIMAELDDQYTVEDLLHIAQLFKG